MKNEGFLSVLVVSVICPIVIAAMSMLAYADGERELAMVMAAKVRHGISRRAEMPDAPPGLDLSMRGQAPSQTPTPLPGDVVDLLDSRAAAIESLEKERRELIEKLKEREKERPEPQKAEPEKQPVSASPRMLDEGGELSLSLQRPVGAAADDTTPFQCVMFTGEDVHGAGWCANCPDFKRRFGIGCKGLEIAYSGKVAPGSQIYPAWRWKDGKGVWRQPVDRHGNYRQPKDAEELLEWVETTGPQEHHSGISTATSGVGGAMRTQGKVRGMLDLWSERIGVGESVSLRVDRTGAQSLSVTKLMAGQPWTTLMIAGKFGHVEISTTSKRMPGGVQELGFTYKTLDNGRFSVDLDAVVVGIPTEQPKAKAMGANEAYGVVDPVSIGFYVYSFATALYQILNPQVDVGLGGCVACQARMDGETLTVDFSECPSVHVAVWFKFDLEVQRVTICQTNIHVDFKPQPQNWIRVDSRDFAIED